MKQNSKSTIINIYQRYSKISKISSVAQRYMVRCHSAAQSCIPRGLQKEPPLNDRNKIMMVGWNLMLHLTASGRRWEKMREQASLQNDQKLVSLAKNWMQMDANFTKISINFQMFPNGQTEGTAGIFAQTPVSNNPSL